MKNYEENKEKSGHNSNLKIVESSVNDVAPRIFIIYLPVR